MLARNEGVIAGILKYKSNGHKYEIIIVKVAPCERVYAGIWVWCSSGSHYLYGFYKRDRYIDPHLKEVLLNTPELYEDAGGHFEDHLRGLFHDWVQLRDVIVANLPQPIAEEVAPEIEWKHFEEYIEIMEGNAKLLESLGLRKCLRE